jgi:dipeptidase
MNEHGVAIAECTCSSIFGASSVDLGGNALLNYLELTRVALERCSTARDAIDLMGSLAEEYGFFGNEPALAGAAESLAVADTEEAWLFHIMPDDSGSSAIWAAQRVPHGHATACANMFTIRVMDLHDADNFRYSQSCLGVATRLELWEPGTPFDFARTYSHGEGLAKYSGRRVWRALSLLAPSLGLNPHYGDLLLEPEALPFCVQPESPATPEAFFLVMRDNYQGTEFDLSKGGRGAVRRGGSLHGS